MIEQPFEPVGAAAEITAVMTRAQGAGAAPLRRAVEEALLATARGSTPA